MSCNTKCTALRDVGHLQCMEELIKPQLDCQRRVTFNSLMTRFECPCL